VAVHCPVQHKNKHLGEFRKILLNRNNEYIFFEFYFDTKFSIYQKPFFFFLVIFLPFLSIFVLKD
jgi:hypothetical protein